MPIQRNTMIGIIITVFIGLLFGTVLISTISDQVYTVTGKQPYKDTISIASARVPGSSSLNNTYYFHVTKTCPYATQYLKDVGAGCQLGSVVVTNSSGTAWVLDTDYSLNLTCDVKTGWANGDVYFLNTTKTANYVQSNTTYVYYTYCDTSYQTGFSNSMIALVPGFAALAILGFSIILIAWFLRNEGIELN